MAGLGVVICNVYHDGYQESFHEPRLPTLLTGLPPGKAIACDDGGFTYWLKLIPVPWHAENEGTN